MATKKPTVAKGSAGSSKPKQLIKLSYPEDIWTPAWASRCIKIYIKMSPRHPSSVGNALDTALTKMTEAVNKASSFATDNLGIAINRNANSKSKAHQTMGVIALPLPNTFTDSQSHGWNVERGIWGTIGNNIMQESLISLAGQAISAGGDVVGKFVPGAGKALNAVGNLTDRLGSGVSTDRLVGSMASAAGRRRPIIDPGYFQNYTGSDPREFNMKFDFIPKNAAEADKIVQIITRLKQYSSPSIQIGGVTCLAPYYFKIEFGNPFMANMINIDRVVIKNISVDYGADGFMQQHADGMPKHIEMAITFAEADMVTAEDYDTIPALPSKKPKAGTAITLKK